MRVSCVHVPMCEKKNDEKGYFSSWIVRSADIIKGRENSIFVGEGYVFSSPEPKTHR